MHSFDCGNSIRKNMIEDIGATKTELAFYVEISTPTLINELQRRKCFPRAKAVADSFMVLWVALAESFSVSWCQIFFFSFSLL